MPDPIPDAYGKLRPVYAFVMVLGYSRMLTVVFSFRTRLVDFLRCHAEALAFFGGTPRTIVYDNLKSVVLWRRGAEVTPIVVTPTRVFQTGQRYRKPDRIVWEHLTWDVIREVPMLMALYERDHAAR